MKEAGDDQFGMGVIGLYWFELKKEGNGSRLYRKKKVVIDLELVFERESLASDQEAGGDQFWFGGHHSDQIVVTGRHDNK